jgi:hypothetical protein
MKSSDRRSSPGAGRGPLGGAPVGKFDPDRTAAVLGDQLTDLADRKAGRITDFSARFKS